MTPKQRAFAEYYIETGNATEAARRAGYKGSSNTLAVVGAENLRKPYISEYIREQLTTIASGRMASAEEVISVFSEILRGSVSDPEGNPASFHDRIEAGKAILRRLERIEDRDGGSDVLAAAAVLLGKIESVIE